MCPGVWASPVWQGMSVARISPVSPLFMSARQASLTSTTSIHAEGGLGIPWYLLFFPLEVGLLLLY